MECARIRERFSEYVDDFLEQKEKSVVEAHLLTCTGCRKELATLKALVRELGTLYSVKEPTDFLANTHKRTTHESHVESISESGWEQLMRKLFVPWRIKMPLELAMAAAAAVLVFAVYNVPMPQKVAETHHSSAPQVLWPETPAHPTMEEKPAEFESFFEAIDIGSRQIKKAPTELALLLKQDGFREQNPSVGGALDFFSAPNMQAGGPSEITGQGAWKITMHEETSDQEFPLALRSSLPVNKPTPLKAAEIEDIRGQILDLVTRAGGSFLPPRPEKLDVPPTICAEIPSDQYSRFCRELERLGTFQIPPPTVPETDLRTVSLLIRLIPSR